MYQRILVPTDGSEITGKAVAAAIGLARLTGAELIALAVKAPFPYDGVSEFQFTSPSGFLGAQEKVATARLAEVEAAAKAAGVACVVRAIEAPHPWEGIVEQAKAECADLIVMASHGRRGVSALLLGSETQKVLTHCTLPVLVVR
jgi:nucleotide-binding universal stress UspA family protein